MLDPAKNVEIVVAIDPAQLQRLLKETLKKKTIDPRYSLMSCYSSNGMHYCVIIY